MKPITSVILCLFLVVGSVLNADAVEVRIKDVTTIAEMSANQLWGMGIVVE